MATAKGLCPYCHPKQISRRIFLVNPGASTCFCPLCLKEIEPKIALDGYAALINNMLSKADNTLFYGCDPFLAYTQYAEVIEFEPKHAHALLGRILCLIYMGRVRKSFLIEATILLENTSLDGCDIDDYIFFLKKINFALDEYENAVNKKLKFRNYYFDVDCLKLYWTHLGNIIAMKDTILSLLKAFKTKNKIFQTDFLTYLERSIEEKKKILHLESFTCLGESYKFLKFMSTKPVVQQLQSEHQTHLARYRLSSLYDDKNKRYIKDDVFKDYAKIAKFQKVSFVLSILFFLAIGAFIFSAFYYRNSNLYFYSFLSSAILSFMISTTLFFGQLYWKISLKKRRLRSA